MSVVILLAGCGGAVEEMGEPASPATEPAAEEPPAGEDEPLAGDEVVPVAEQLEEIDRLLHNTMEGALAYAAPSALDMADIGEVRLVVDLTQSPDTLVATLDAESGGQQVEGALIATTGQMRAELKDLDQAFTIEPLATPLQLVGSSEPTEWKWLVKPRREGRHRLYLVVSRLVEYGEHESWRTVEEYRSEIAVTVAPGARLLSMLQVIFQEYVVELLCGAFLLPALGAIAAVLLQHYLGRRGGDAH